MKVRKMRKRTLDRIRRNRGYHWAFKNFVDVVFRSTSKLSKAMEEAYAKAREGRHEN
jgi:hypothetical protein